MKNERQRICSKILAKAKEYKQFTESELTFIEEIICWLKDPADDLIFSFSLSQSNNGESIYIDFSHDGEFFKISETHHAYEVGVGGDTFTAYDFVSCKSYQEEDGDIYSFENQVLGLLDFYEEDSETFEIYLSREI